MKIKLSIVIHLIIALLAGQMLFASPILPMPKDVLITTEYMGSMEKCPGMQQAQHCPHQNQGDCCEQHISTVPSINLFHQTQNASQFVPLVQTATHVVRALPPLIIYDITPPPPKA